jgi:hypothetical protein
VSERTGSAGGATPRVAIRRDQKCWSPPNGQMTCGRPASTAAAVVPEPPWCTIACTRGNSQSCGTLLITRNRLAGSRRRSSGLSEATTARAPAWRTAVTIAAARRSGSGLGMLPKPR